MTTSMPSTHTTPEIMRLNMELNGGRENQSVHIFVEIGIMKDRNI
jgi:hypothetical protein